MPLFLIFVGIAMMLLAWQNNQLVFVQQVGQDFSEGFFPWFGAVLALGALGYVPDLKGFTRGILGLVLLVFVLANGKGLFSQLESVIQGGTPSAEAATPAPSDSFTASQAPGNVLLGGEFAGADNDLSV
jgi:hypothetical protein